MDAENSQEYRRIARHLSFETDAFVNGRFVPSISARKFDTEDPATGRKIASIAECDAFDVDAAVKAARVAFEAGRWSRMSPRERKKVLLRFADLIQRDLVELAVMETLDCGKPISDSMTVDLPDSIETLRWHAEAIDKLYDQMSPSPHDVVSMIIREPIGVVGTVLPWNFPIFVAMWKIAPALASGNSLIVKPAEQTSLTMLRLAKLASEAGIPDGVFNVVPGFGETAGQAIGRHMDIDCVSFTGSGAVGRQFLKYSAESNLKNVTLECGGKSPALVMDDVTDLSLVAEHVTAGILFCQGENCSAGSRLIAHEKVADQLLDTLKSNFATWTVGDPLSTDTKVGALIERPHLEKVLSLSLIHI